jgi:cation diffusion facilitator family transporter
MEATEPQPQACTREHPADRLAAARRVFAETLALNLFTAGTKLAWGLASHSLAMVADGFHSLLDAASNVIGIVALNISRRPPDSDHPYGHRKFEAVAAIVISFFLFTASFEVFKEAVARLVADGGARPFVSWVSYTVVGVNLVVSAATSRYETRKGRELDNQLLLADAQHTASDVFTSLSVLAALIAVELEAPVLDVVAAVAIVALIFRAGYRIILTHLGALVDAAVLDPGEVREAVLAVPGVVGCAGIRSRGPTDHVFIDLRVQVGGALSVEEGHRIAHEVEDRLRERFAPKIAEVLVHIEGGRRAEIHR